MIYESAVCELGSFFLVVVVVVVKLVMSPEVDVSSASLLVEVEDDDHVCFSGRFSTARANPIRLLSASNSV